MPAAERGLWRPYTQEGLKRPAVSVERASGPFLYTREGQRLLDGVSSWWVITHGHCEPAIVEAVRSQAERVDQVLFANFSHAAAEDLVDQLLSVVHPHLSRVFLSDNGSTAVEVALKIAVQCQSHRGNKKRTKFLAFSHAYHGDTVGSMSVSARGLFTAPFGKMTFDVLRAEQPKSSKAECADWTAGFQRIWEEHHEEIAGVILEPLLQGAAGMVMWPVDAVREIAECTRDSGALLIFDEVLTGFGRTGTLFAYEQIKICPDLLCLSKGLTGGMLPLGATLASHEVFAAFQSREKEKMFFHGHSFTGNPLACAAAAANLRLCRDPEFLQRISNIERIHRERLALVARQNGIDDPRVQGPVAAFELPGGTQGYSSGQAEAITARAMELGLFLRPLGDTIYLMPPYSSEGADLHAAWDAIQIILQETKY